jgi:MFS family permease
MMALAFGGVYGWTTWWVVGGFLAFVLAAPVFLWVEAHHHAPLLDLSLFRSRLFAMGNLTGFLNAIARNGVLFLLVFYLQGARGEDPVTAGIMLAPLAIGLIVLADRYGSRALATAGMVITGLGLAGLMTLEPTTPYWQLAFWQLVVGAGSGIFNSPNTSAVMGVVPPSKRGVGAGTRMMLMQSGFVVSIALAIGLVTSSMDPKVLVAIFSGTQIGGRGISLVPFMNALHLAFGAGVVASALGAVASLMRGEHRSFEAADERPAIGREGAT